MDMEKFRKSTKYNFEKRKKQRRFTRLNRKKCEKGQIVLFGDSITELYKVEWLDEYTDLKVYNRGISGDTSDRLLERIEDNLLNLAPSKVFLLIGINDISRGADVEFIFAVIQMIINVIRAALPKTEVILECVYPVHLEGTPFEKQGDESQRVRELNALLKPYAFENNIPCIDLTEELQDENGYFDSRYTYDGLHPNEEGYKIVTKAIAKYL